MNCRETATTYRATRPLGAGLLILWLMTACNPSVAGAENAPELSHSIRRLTQPVAKSVRTVIQSNLSLPQDNAGPAADGNGAEISEAGVSPTSTEVNCLGATDDDTPGCWTVP